MSRRELIKSKAPLNRAEKVDSNLPEDNVKATPKIALTEIHLPEINPAFGYLLEFYYLSGQVSQEGMGISPITWKELRAFREENELDILIWERRLLKRMSEEYCSEYAAASDKNRPAPYSPEQDEEEIDKVAVAANIRDALAALRGKNGH